MVAPYRMRVAWDLCLWSLRRPLLHRSFHRFPHRPQRLSHPINYNPSVFEDDDTDYTQFERVTAAQLASSKVPPRRVKMLVRDFIDDSLYNPHYGYFSKQAVIFSSKDPLDFNSIRDSRELESCIAEQYGDYTSDARGPGRQVWHTPTELFKPWYGQAIAQCILSEYMLKSYPYDDLVIYEIGAGNGTLAADILDYVRVEYPPDVHERLKYNIIEISPKLAQLQRDKLTAQHPGVQVFNKSIFDWQARDNASCFFIALEVIDNFAHDQIRYSMETRKPFQGLVAIDEAGEFTELYEPVTDALITHFLNLRRETGHDSPVFPISSPLLRRLRAALPFAPNLSQPDYIPTRLLQLLQILRNNFPRHRLLLSDFSSLPDAIPGHNAPVVQTRVHDTMVPCSTLLVQQGYFDIFFPTPFKLLRDMYEHTMSKPHVSPIEGTRASPLLTSASPVDLGANFFSSHGRRPPGDTITSAIGLPVGGRKSSVFTHREFMETYAALAGTQLRNRENPLLDYYQNVKFLF